MLRLPVQKRSLEEYVAFAKKQGIDNVESVLTFGSPKVLMAEELPRKVSR